MTGLINHTFSFYISNILSYLYGGMTQLEKDGITSKHCDQNRVLTEDKKADFVYIQSS